MANDVGDWFEDDFADFWADDFAGVFSYPIYIYYQYQNNA